MRTIKLFRVLVNVSILVSLLSCTTENSEVINQTLYQSGEGNYNGYRIPSLITTPQGTVLAFAEGREEGDAGNIDLLLRRSTDNGVTWSEPLVVWDDSNNTCGNPCPVIDESTGRIWLFMTWNLGSDHEGEIIQRKSQFPRSPYLCYSDDDGLTWSEPVSMESTCRDTAWGWYATGPGIGIQLKNGPHKGRMVIPANHSYYLPGGSHHVNYEYGAHVLYSDDSGKTWQRGPQIGPRCNESQVAELSDGTLIMNMRSYHGKQARALSYSNDGGTTWNEIIHNMQLVESVCQASFLNFGDFKGENIHLFLNPGVPHGRTHLTLKTSFDDCKTWSNAKLINPGNSAYSCMTRLPNGHLGIFFEHGKEHPYEKMTFMAFPVDEIFSKKKLN